MKSLSKFARALAGIAAAALVSQAAIGDDGQVRQKVSVKWTDMTPVVGAKVFDNTTNMLLGVTGRKGSVAVKTSVGAVLRIVEPDYGQQQAVIVVKAAVSDEQSKNGTGGGSAADALVFWMF
jgi:hypothetical protein